jgi:hypothetical protein
VWAILGSSEVLADLEGIDAIITDPPYGAEYLPLLDDLAAWADKVLAPDGVLLVMFGQHHLEEAMRRLSGLPALSLDACLPHTSRGLRSARGQDAVPLEADHGVRPRTTRR